MEQTLTGQAAEMTDAHHSRLVELKCAIRDLVDKAVEEARVEWERAQKADLTYLQERLAEQQGKASE